MKQAVQLGAMSAMNMALLFLFQWYVFTKLGPGTETDALFAGMTVPQLVLNVISFSLMHVLVPLLAGEDENRLVHDAWAFLALVAGLFGILAGLLYIAAPWWVPLSVPGFEPAAQDLTVSLTRIQLIGMVFTAVNGVQWATYHARQKFLWAEFSPILASTVAFLLLVWALPKFGVVAAAWILATRTIVLTFLLAPGMGRFRRPTFSSPTVGRAWVRLKPLLLGTAYYKTEPLVDRFLLSSGPIGSLSLFYLAQQLYGAVNQIFNKALVAPLVPMLSKLHKSGDRSGFRSLYRRKLFQIACICISGLAFLLVVGHKALVLLIGYGGVTDANVANLWWLMVLLAGMFFGGAVGQVSASSFYAAGDTRTPVRLGMLTYTFFVPCKVIAFLNYGISGLAIATSIYYLVNFFFQFHILTKGQFHDAAATSNT